MKRNLLRKKFGQLLAIAILTPVYSLTAQSWSQRGADFDGEAAGDYFGNTVALSANGRIMAVGSNLNDGTGPDAGSVRVYEWNTGTSSWGQIGADIDGETTDDQFSISLKLSGDGSTLVVGAHRNDGNGGFAGHVRVYDWNGTNWVQRGLDIDGEAAFDESGFSVGTSSDGNVIIIGAPKNDGNGSNAGHARVYTWDLVSTAWVQRGADINGEAAGDLFGSSVAISSNGNIVAIGATGNDGTASDAGHVRVFTWNGGSSTWVQRGSDIDGEAANDFSCNAIAMSSNGNTLAIGALNNDGTASDAGHVRVYDWNGTNWVKRGNDLDGEAFEDYSGTSVAIAADGNTVAIGAPRNDGTGTNAGHARVYIWNSGTLAWEQRGSDINAEAAGDRYGTSVALSADGLTLAVGAPQNDGNGANAGQIRIVTHPNILCASGNVVWDGGGSNTSFFTKVNWVNNIPPCPDANAVFNGTSSKQCIIGDTLEIGSISTTKAYGNRIRLTGKNNYLTTDDMDLEGSTLNVEAAYGRITTKNFSISENTYAECSENGMDVSGNFVIGNAFFSSRQSSTLNFNHFSIGRSGLFKIPGGTGIVSSTGNFSKHAISTFDSRNGTWRFVGSTNSSLDPGVGATSPVRIVFHNFTVAKTNSNTLTITNNDTVQVNNNFVVSGTNSRIQGGVLNAKGNITMGQSFSDGAFNKVLITGTTNQTITCDNASEFSETVVLDKSSGSALLGKNLNLKSVRFYDGILDPNGFKITLTDNDISGQSNTSNIKDRAYVLKTDAAFSGNSITVPLSNGNGSSLNSISLNTTGSHNDWQLDYVAVNPSTIDSDLDASLSSISSTGYWRVQRLSSSAGSAETFLNILADAGFDKVALLDGGKWRSIGGTVSGNNITSTESSLFAGTGDWYITAGTYSVPGSPNPIVVAEDAISGEQIALEKNNTAATKTETMNSGMFVYPNPATQYLNVQLPAGATSYTISDLSGRVLISQSANLKQVNLQNLSNGMYLISTEVEGKTYSVRFVKD
jgi:hypothetical protein